MLGLATHKANRFLLVLVLSLFVPSTALGGICLPPQPKPDSPYDYLLALVDALGWAKSARDRVPQAPSKNADLISSVTEAILAIKLADRDYECGTTTLTPYKASRDEAVKTSASGTSMVFKALIELDREFIEQHKRLLSLAPNSPDLGTYLEQSAELGAKADDIWKTLPLAVIASTYSVVEVDPSTRKLARLTLSSTQRAEIVKKLLDTFGPSIQKGMQAGQLSLEAAAGALYQFLSDKQWKSRDAQ